jgi:hypothetical protein
MHMSVALILWWMFVAIVVIFKDALYLRQWIFHQCSGHMATKNILDTGLVGDMFPSPMLSAMTWAFQSDEFGINKVVSCLSSLQEL